MAALSAFSSHLFVLVLHCYLGASSSSSSSSSPVKSSSRSASSSSQDDRSSSSLLQEVQVPLFLHMDQEDMVSEHMFRLYDKYNRESRLREGNTVRSFRAQRDTADQRTDTADQRTVYRLNLTSIQDTEVVLSATFHFLLDRRPTTNQRAWFCKRFKSPSCRSSLPVRPSPSVSLLFRSARPGGSSGVASGSSLLANVTFHPHRRGAWQMKDVTPVVKRAREKGHVLVWVELDSEEALPADAPPYVLLYADDRALGEPNSVAASLQRYDPFPEVGGGGGAEASSHSSHSHRSVPHGSNSSPEPTGRVRREAALLLSDPVHNNELPEVHYRPDGYMKDDLWERTWHLALKPKAKPKKKRKGQEGGGAPAEQDRGAEDVVGEPQARGGGGGKQAPPPQVPNPPDQAADKKPRDRDGGLPDGGDVKSEDERRAQGKERKRHPGRAEGSKVQSPVLSFDERTMRKARRRQWGGEGGQDRGCTRRNLRVDFADIGWSEWVVAPKAFEAYYCTGTCGFPMPKVLRPSNHATIQSIVRAVGIIPGVPEPCCVPEKMSSLAVLYQDEARNLVLKVYPNMSIQSCSCR